MAKELAIAVTHIYLMKDNPKKLNELDKSKEKRKKTQSFV